MWVTIKKEELAEKDEEIKRQIAVNKEMYKIIGEKDEEIRELRNRVAEKDKVLAIYKRALELACFNVDCMYCSNFECRKEPYNEKHNCIECGELGLTQKHLSKYFLDLAKEKLEKGDEEE